MNEPKKRSLKTSYTIRIAAGAYLLYTVYSIYKDWDQVKPKQELLIGAACIIFVIMGLLLCVTSSIGLQRIKRNPEAGENTESQLLGEENDQESKEELLKGDGPVEEYLERDESEKDQSKKDQSKKDQSKKD